MEGIEEDHDLEDDIASAMADADDADLLLLLMLLRLEESSRPFVHSRNRHVFYNMLSAECRRRRDRRIPREALVHPSMSNWVVLFGSGNDQALITATGFDHETFRWMLPDFEEIYLNYTPNSRTGLIERKMAHRGRPRHLDAAACLGLTLFWTRSQGAEYSLAMHFGITATPCSVWIRFGRRILVQILRNKREASVSIPTEAEICSFVEAIGRRHPLLWIEMVMGAMDGLKLYVEASGDEAVQSRFYNGWTHDHYVSNVFYFVPDGTMRFMCINCPGTMHDSLAWAAYTGNSSVFGICMELSRLLTRPFVLLGGNGWSRVCLTSHKCPTGVLPVSLRKRCPSGRHQSGECEDSRDLFPASRIVSRLRILESERSSLR